MLITRRSLLTLAAAAAGAGAVAMATSSSTRAASPPMRKLVLVELQGGNDGLNTVVPLSDIKRYRTLRPTLAIDDAIDLGIGAGVGLHPSLAPLAKVFER